MDHELFILDSEPQSSRAHNTFKQKNIQLFQVQSDFLKHKMEDAKCLECHHKESNVCKNMAYVNYQKRCTPTCLRIPKTNGAFTNNEIDLRIEAQ